MPYHVFTLGGSQVSGFRVEPSGAVVDFAGTLRNRYNGDLARASAAARRKYHDQTITITECDEHKQRYRCPLDALMQISEPID